MNTIPEDLLPVILGLLRYSFAEVTEFKYLTETERAIVKDEVTFVRLRALAGLPAASKEVE